MDDVQYFWDSTIKVASSALKDAEKLASLTNDANDLIAVDLQRSYLNELNDLFRIWKDQRNKDGQLYEIFATRTLSLVARAESCEQHKANKHNSFLYDVIQRLDATTNEDQANLELLSRQIDSLKAKAGESEALRGQIEALQITVGTLRESITDKQNIIDTLKVEAPVYKRAYHELEKELDGLNPRYATTGEFAKKVSEIIKVSRDHISKELRERLLMSGCEKIIKADQRKTMYFPIPRLIESLIEWRRNTASDDENLLTASEWAGELAELGKKKSEIPQ